MSQPFLCEIKLVAFNYPPKGWALCNGQIMSIQQNAALFSLMGTTYGGNGTTTFALPNLQGRSALSWGNSVDGNNYVLGEQSGEPTHTLLLTELPAHNHLLTASSNNVNVDTALNNVPGSSTDNPYNPTANTTMNPGSISHTGGSQPHDNMPPYLVLNYVIALSGIFPTRN
jgi:microcystin-dependent protein